MDQTSKIAIPNRIEDLTKAAMLLANANRVLVIGCSGGGKSTLSQAIAKRRKLRYISFDRDIFWMPGWTERPRPEQRALVRDFAAGDQWIMDGSNPSSFDIRVPRSDFIIWVRVPRLLCIWGVATRWVKYLGRTRPEMAPGCPEKIDWDFLRFIWTFEEKFTKRIVDGIAEHGPQVPVFELKSRRQIRRLLDLLGAPA